MVQGPLFKNWAIPGLYTLFSSLKYILLKHLVINKIADGRIQTADLRYRRQPLNQLRHNHSPFIYHPKTIATLSIGYLGDWEELGSTPA